jgi:hypothetical protein
MEVLIMAKLINKEDTTVYTIQLTDLERITLMGAIAISLESSDSELARKIFEELKRM